MWAACLKRFSQMCSLLREYLSENPLTPWSFWLHVNQCAFPSPPGHMHEADNHLEVWKRCHSSLSQRSASSQIPDVQPDVTVMENIPVIWMSVKSACYMASGNNMYKFKCVFFTTLHKLAIINWINNSVNSVDAKWHKLNQRHRRFSVNDIIWSQ